MINTW